MNLHVYDGNVANLAKIFKSQFKRRSFFVTDSFETKDNSAVSSDPVTELHTTLAVSTLGSIVERDYLLDTGN